MRDEGQGMDRGGSGRQVVRQLNECESTVETLSLLLEAALRGSSLAAFLLFRFLLLLLLLILSVLLVGLEELHGVLLLLVLGSCLARWLSRAGGRGGPLLASPPVPARRRERTWLNAHNAGSTIRTLCDGSSALGLPPTPRCPLTLPATRPPPCCPPTEPTPGYPSAPPSSDGRRDAWGSDGWRVWTDCHILQRERGINKCRRKLKAMVFWDVFTSQPRHSWDDKQSVALEVPRSSGTFQKITN